MSKEATIIQTYNDTKRVYEYFVKGFDVSESIKVLLKAHKEAYDNERRVFAECKGYCDAEKEFKERIADLEAKLAEKERIIETQHNGIGYWMSVAEKRPDFDYVVKIKDLEQQLAEKDRQIEQLKKYGI